MLTTLAALVIMAQPPAITEVMADPLNEDACEFVEFHNPAGVAVDLAGFSLTDGDALDYMQAWDEAVHGDFPDPDAVTGTTLIPPGAYAVLFETGYLSAPAYDIPPGTVVLTTGDASICNGLAAASDPLTLFDAAGTADSNAVSTYGTPVPSDAWQDRDDDGLDAIPFDPGDGLSVERIAASFPDTEQGWAAGPPGGTPGLPPTGAGVNVACISLSVSETQPPPGAAVTATALFLCNGTLPCPGGALTLFIDYDADSTAGPGDPILAQADAAGLLPGQADTLTATFSLEQGWFCLAGLAACTGDTIPGDDHRTACVAPGGGTPAIVTEVMADPLSEDTDEFIEIHFPGPGAFPLAGSRLTDGDALDIISAWSGPFPDADAAPSRWLPAGRTAVVLDPEYILGATPYDLPESTIVATVSNTTLGNGLTADDPVTLYGPFGTGIADVLSTYGTPTDSPDPLLRDDDGLDGIPFDPGDGLSVERTYLFGPDAEYNWAASVPGGTPGSVPQPSDSLDACALWISFEEQVRFDADHLMQASCAVMNCGGVPSPGFDAVLFLDLDADSAAGPSEIVATLAVPPLAPGTTDTLPAQFTVQDGPWLAGCTVMLPGDEDPSDDTVLGWFTVGEAALPVLTEIVCNPGDEDRDEFVEIFFPGPGVFDAAGCHLSDGDAVDVIVPWSPGHGEISDPDAIPSSFLPAGSWAVILDSEYASGLQPWDLEPGTRVLTTGNTTLGDGLAGTDPLVLYTAGGTTLADIASTYGTPMLDDDPLLCDDDGLDGIPFNPGEGLSVHRIVIAGPDGEWNWAGIDPTPGGPAEGVQPGISFAPAGILLEPPMGEEGWAVQVTSLVASLGTDPAAPGDLQVLVFADADYSGTPSPAEIVFSGLPDPPAPGDTIAVQAAWVAMAVQVPVIVVSTCSGDSISADDTLSVLWNRHYDIVINEVMYHPQPGGPEWLELLNASDDPLDLAGLVLSDSRESVTVTTAATVLPPGGYAVVTSDSSDFSQAWPEVSCIILQPPSWPALNDQTQPGQQYADDLRLALPDGQVVDRVPYDDEWGGGTGTSLEKTGPLLHGWLSGSWTSCSAGGTPGMRNTSFDPGGGSGFLSFWPDPFSPDGDGEDDFLDISVDMTPQSGSVTVIVYNVQGRPVRTLADSAPCTGVLHLLWDGTADGGARLAVGRYIVFARARGQSGESREAAGVVILARPL